MNVSVKTKTAVVAALLALSVLAVFAPLGQHDFIDFDDNVYVTDNRRVQAGLTIGNAVWAFTTLDRGMQRNLKNAMDMCRDKDHK